MAISPPSDLVLDVLKAADPARVQEAQAKLKSNRAASQASSLAEAGMGFPAAVGVLNRETAASAASVAGGKTAVPEHLRRFESMVLQNFVKSMLPAESEDVYGKGTAGEIWRGMMAEQLGEVLAKGGGIGIAESLAASSGIGAMRDGRPAPDRIAAGMVQSLQREAFAALTPAAREEDRMPRTS